MSSAKSFHETFYGTPTEEESRGRRGKKRHKAAKEEPQNEVVVIGVHYRSFDDDSMAAFVNSATALVPWNGDSKLLIDRYDVRHLLQDLTGIRRRRARPPSPDATKEELDFERYRDVEGLENPSPPEDMLTNEDASGDGYQRVGFDYGTGGDQATRKERVEDALFSPPFFVPEHLRLKIPTSTKVHQIMAGTAKYVIEHGGQAEIVLRVKQANNPTFGFLMPDHYDHEYFRFLVAPPENVVIGPTKQEAPPEAEVAAPTSSEEAEGGLSLLGTAYGDADEDEEEDKVGEAGNGQVVVADDLQIKKRIESNGDHGTSCKRSSTEDSAASDRAENATKDTGESLEVSPGSEIPTSSAKPGEGSVDGMVDSSGSQEPVPPGMEASNFGSEEMDGHETHGQSGDVHHQVPPYKEPPIRLRLIINKMVEFIARNGTEFEAIVKERDKTDHRFPFFLPWNEYHPYYVKELESARQAQLSAEANGTGSPSTSEPPSAMQGQVVVNDEKPESFLNGLPFGDASRAVESSGGDAEGGMSNMPQPEEEKTHNEGGMGFDAVLAAVRVATRGRPQAVEGNQESDSRPELGSDEAVLAAIKAATGRTKLDPSVSIGKKEASQVRASNGPVIEARDPAQTKTVSRGAAVGDTQDPILTSTLSRGAALGDTKDPALGDTKDPILTSSLSRVIALGNTEDPILTSTLSRCASVGDFSDPLGHAIPVPQSTSEAPDSLDENHVVAPNVVIKAVAEQPDEEKDLPEAQLSTPEKRRAERLKKAKLFAAMIKDKNGSLTDPAQFSGSLGISAPNLDRLNHVFVALESTTSKSGGEVPAASVDEQPETRDQARDIQMPAVTEVDKEIVDSSVKQRYHKVKSQEQEQRKRKHHKRKKDTDERGKERKGSPGARESKKEKHQDDKRSREPEGRAKDSKRSVSEGKLRSHEVFQDLQYRTEEYDDAWKDRSHYIHDANGRRKERKYGYEAEQKKPRERHGHDSERTRMESRYGYDSEERRTDRRKHDTDRKRKDRRFRHGSEERGNEYDSDELRKERSRSHGKRKKHSERTEESDDEGGRRHEQREEKSRHRGDGFASAAEQTHPDRHSTLHRDLKDDRIRIVSPVRQDAPLPTSLTQIRAGGAKSTLTSADVPDDIRAKVRAMLAMM